MKIAIFGAGAWGTALAISAARRHEVMLWDRVPSVVAEMQKTRLNSVGLPGFELPPSVTVTGDFDETAAFAAGEDRFAMIATSVAGLRPTAELLGKSAVSNIVWVCKGFEENTGLLPSQVVSEVTSGKFTGVLSGPSFAQEVAKDLPCALTVASSSYKLCQLVTEVMNGGNMRIYSSSDVIGVEVGGAVKNILAIATGIADGLNLGMNARAALITRGLVEITRLGVKLGGRAETFSGLTGMGDLILTCTGDLSRNRRVGLGLAEGKPLGKIVEDLGHVAEGVKCAKTVRELAGRYGVDMPIANAVAGVLFEEQPIPDMIAKLLRRHVKNEAEKA